MKAPAIILAILVLLSGLTIMVPGAEAETAPTYYDKMTVTACKFDYTDASIYGDWIYPDVTHDPVGSNASLTKSYDSSSKTEGDASMVLDLTWTNATHVHQYATFHCDNDIPGLRHYLVSIDYKLSTMSDSDIIYVQIYRWIGGGNSSISWENLIADGEWHTFTGTLFNGASDTFHNLEFYFLAGSSTPSNGSIELALDNFKFTAPPCDVRFSFYNAYTGIGLDSDLLIPEFWYDGIWTRVWDNEFRIAAGETIGYRVTDYFGQVITWVPSYQLDETTEYLDISVKLVKVHIEKPTWYSSNLPPTWWLTYTATGEEIPVEGWDLELIAGWYSFRWDEMTVDQGSDIASDEDDLIVEAGEIGQYIDGNLSTGQSFTLSNFYLSMTPTYRAESSSNSTIIPAGFLTWDGIWKLGCGIVDEITTNTFYKSIMLVLGIAGALTFFGQYWYKGKKKAAQQLGLEKANASRNGGKK